MAYGKKMNKMGSGNSGFKPCANCPTPAKCKAAGACAMKSKKRGK